MGSILAKLGSLASGPLGWLANLFLDYVWKKITAAIRQAAKDKANTEAAKKQAEEDMKKADALTENSTKQEQRDAADDAFKHL